MQSFYSWLEETGWLNIISFLVGIAGIILAFVFYVKGKKEKCPVINSQMISIVNPGLTKLKNLEISFAKVPINSLSLSKLAFWNAGKESIRKSDIAAANPILLKVNDDVTIYDFEISYQTPSNNFRAIRIDEHTIQIDFDFIDYNDGVVLKVFHNGFSGNQMKVQGRIIGAKQISQGIKNSDGGKSVVTFRPIEYLVKHENFLLKILGWLLVIPGFIVTLIYILILLPYYFFEYRYNQSHRKEFLLKDYSY